MNLFLIILLGLIVGSFLNVIIHRLPAQMQLAWTEEVSGWLHSALNLRAYFPDQLKLGSEHYSLLGGRSRCHHCGAKISWYDNIPIISFCLLKGRARCCQQPIGIHYPAIELVTSIMFAAVFLLMEREIAEPLFWVVIVLMCCLIVQCAIDWQTQLLPDVINYIILWMGLLSAHFFGTIALSSALLGAVTGYLSLWILFWSYKLATGKEGMGYGDFKLFAALGAWLGVIWLPLLLFGAATMALLFVAVAYCVNIITAKRYDLSAPIAFGPYLAIVGGLFILHEFADLAWIHPLALWGI